jgi:hypothetical protein
MGSGMPSLPNRVLVLCCLAPHTVLHRDAQDE